MSVTFPRVEEVAVGDRVASRHARQVADAITARILSGLGDGARRMVYWWLSAVRQFRNPDAGQSLFPPQHEFLQLYQLLGPSVEYPEAGPGDPEGINLASIMGAFVFGNQAANIDPEDARLGDPGVGGVPVDPASTVGALWELAKRQRGGYDPNTGAMNAPAFRAARQHFWLQQSPTSPHGNSYGGWFPTPVYLGGCGDGTSDTPETNDYEIRFSSLTGGVARVYPGTCPSDPTHVAKVIEQPLGYYVVRFGGQVDYLPKSQWIEGPYSGGNRLSKAPAETLPRVLNRFAGEFRGTEERRAAELAGKKVWLGEAFDIRRFLVGQYLLAPAAGVEQPGGQMTMDYQAQQLTGLTNMAAGTKFGPPIRVTPGFVIAAIYVRTERLVGDTSVVLLDGTTPVAVVPLSPGKDGSAAGIAVLATPSRSGALRWSIGAPTRWDTGGTMRVEVAEIWDYRPGLHDLMLVLRLGGARVAGLDGTDGSGLAADDAREIWAAYAAYGCIPQRRADQYLGGSLDSIGRNAVFDLFRRWANMVRVVPRQQLLAYAVENGKSVLWFKPHVSGLSGSAKADSFVGIRDAIATTATANGYTNRWCVFPEFKRYHPSATSIWKTDVYGDYFLFSDRCGLWTPILPQLDAQLQRHFNLGSGYSAKRSYAPEIMPGYRYAKNLNHSGLSQQFYRSCRLYEAPLEVEKAETVLESGEEVVKVTLTGRLHHHHSLAPAAISRDVSTWVRADLTAEAADYRTEENAIREAILNANDNTYQCEKTGPGNAAANSDILTGLDIPFGACLPHFCFVQLPSAPVADGNDRQDATDTPLTHELMSQHELWIRVLSEGAVDGETTVDYGCQTGIEAVFDFKFSNLCFKAFGSASFLTLGSAPTERLPADEIRADKPVGYGPLPTLRPTAEVHNLFARALNKLTRYRVMLPFQFEVRTLRDSATRTASGVTKADGSATTCPGGTDGFVFSGDPGDVSAVTEIFGWGSAAAPAYSQLSGAFAITGSAYLCSGSAFVTGVVREEQEYRWSLVDPDAQYAMPETWRDMVLTTGEMLAQITTTIGRVLPDASGSGPGTTCNGVFYWTVGGVHVAYNTDAVTTTECRLMPVAGRVHCPALGSVQFIGASGSPICDGLAASSVTSTRNLAPIQTDALILSIGLTGPAPETP